MSVYARRRIAALCVLALLVGGAYAAFSGGGSPHPKASRTTTTVRRSPTGRPGGSELAALAVTPAGARPKRTTGEGCRLV